MSIKRRMDRDGVVYIHNRILVIKRNKIGSFVEMWMDLESVMQCEVSSEKIKYHILMYICGLPLWLSW